MDASRSDRELRIQGTHQVLKWKLDAFAEYGCLKRILTHARAKQLQMEAPLPRFSPPHTHPPPLTLARQSPARVLLWADLVGGHLDWSATRLGPATF